MNNQEFVYVLYNEFSPFVYKIGFTTRSPHDRASEISRGTGSPGKWRVIHFWEVDDGAHTEKLVHKHFSDKRISLRNEHFYFKDHNSDEVVALISDFIGSMGEVGSKITDAEREEYERKKQAVKTYTAATPFDQEIKKDQEIKQTNVSFAAFFLIYAEALGWDVPDFHLDVCDFLEDYGSLGLLMMPRGHGKSTILDIYNAWMLFVDNQRLILHQGATDNDAAKCSRGTQQVIEKHPLCQLLGVHKARGELQKWWVNGSEDVRHGSLHARGVLSNVTGARANDIQNDDVEMPANIGTPEAREKLRYRLSEQTHILIPGGRKLFVGTPHTHDSLYTQIQKQGAKCMILKMFEQEKRFEHVTECLIDFDPVYVFSGISHSAKLLVKNKDYLVRFNGNTWTIIFNECHYLIDVYSESLWPERFTPKVMEERRQECRTLNEWDSQYQMHAKPVGDVRLDPDKMIPYDCEPVLRSANGHYIMMLGERQIVGLTCRWDPSSGKTKSDISSVALVLHDDFGNKYWHRSIALKGEVIETDAAGNVKGGQVWQLCDLVEQFHVPRVVLESNGIGGFAAASLKAALKKRGIRCGVTEHHSVGAKNKRILSAIEGPLVSGLLWVHTSVVDTPEEGENSSPQYKKMRAFNPAITEQEDDELDSLAGAITDQPERVGKIHNKNEVRQGVNWRNNGGVVNVTTSFD